VAQATGNKGGHKVKAGDIAEINNGTQDNGKPYIEGRAKLIRPSDIGDEGLADGYEFWVVEFTDQLGEYFDRIVS